MKMAPLSAYLAKNVSRMGDPIRRLELITRMTHDNDLSVVASLVHYEVSEALMRGRLDHEEVPLYAAFIARWAEKRYPGASSVVSGLLGRLASLEQIDPDAIVALAPKGGFYSPETLVMAYGSFAIEPIFPKSAVEAVNLGGDADSIGSIVSAMSVMYQQEVEWPEDIEKIDNLDHLRRLSVYVCAAVHDDGRRASFGVTTDNGWFSASQNFVPALPNSGA
jgi:ADP-ribosylglycohydrolase